MRRVQARAVAARREDPDRLGHLRSRCGCYRPPAHFLQRRLRSTNHQWYARATWRTVGAGRSAIDRGPLLAGAVVGAKVRHDASPLPLEDRRRCRAAAGRRLVWRPRPGAARDRRMAGAGLELPDLAGAPRRAPRPRARAAGRRLDLAAIVVADPINIRYATDSANMQVWCLHNPVRYAFVATEGPVILFDSGCAHLSDHLAPNRRGPAGARLVLISTAARGSPSTPGAGRRRSRSWSGRTAAATAGSRSTRPTGPGSPRLRPRVSSCTTARRSWSTRARANRGRDQGHALRDRHL